MRISVNVSQEIIQKDFDIFRLLAILTIAGLIVSDLGLIGIDNIHSHYLMVIDKLNQDWKPTNLENLIIIVLLCLNLLRKGNK